MAVFKCKMCGGNLDIEQGVTVYECEYCGTKQTVPSCDDEKKLTLFTRANRLRFNCEFDKAAGVYESIVADFPEEAEAYWGLVLCKYGIEYVDDPATAKKIPTCHRSSFESVMDDSNFEMALEYADAVARPVYRDEAKAIEEIRKGIIEVSSKEEPYDIFICYKETDENGDRTLDSVIAQDVYTELTDKGYRVFFSRISLEDKLGQEYEPYIFAALNSAKVMLAFGTDYEYYNAVWVKNEWSRFLQLIAAGEKKTLIPCYKGIDAYDMPKEFARLQAQDMGKVGAIQDLVRGIEKIIPKTPNETVVKETVVVGGNDNTAPLLKRAFMFLEDGDWKSANEYCEKVLDIDPENAEAYLGKLLSELNVRKQESLKDQSEPFDNSNNYQKAVRFADEKLKAELRGYIDYIETRNEIARKDFILSTGKAKMTNDFISDCEDAMKLFKSIPGWKDVDEQIIACQKKIEELKAKEEAKRQERERKAEIERKEAERIAKRNKKIALIATPIICVIIAFIIVLNTVIIPNGKYNDAVKLMEAGKYTEAIAAFEAMDGYKDSDDKIIECNYGQAVKLSEEEKYTEAIAVFEAMNGYKDSDDKIIECNYKQAVKLSEEEKYTEAIAVFEAMNGYKDSIEKISECNYRQAVKLMEEEKYIEAIAAFVALSGYKDAKEKALKLWESVAVRNTVSAGAFHTVGLKSDGTVVAVGDNYCGQCDVSDWKDIVAVSASGDHTVGLKSDGTVVAVGDNYNGQCDVSDWKDIVAVLAGRWHTVGLKVDGTVVAVGANMGELDGQCNVSDWKDIVAVSAGYYHTIGLKVDGTVVAVGSSNYNGQCDVSSWKNIVAVSAGRCYTVGLKSDGTVVAVGENDDGQCNVSDWKDIVAVSAGDFHTVGLKSDGTVVAVGDNFCDQCDVSDWKDIVAVSAGGCHTVGLKADGTVVAVGANNTGELGYGQGNVSDWKNIKLPKKK